jgi:hypothetical protein
MPRLVRSFLLLLASSALSAANPDPTLNNLVVVVGNGPLAGTYTPAADTVICFHAGKQKVLTSAFKDFDAHDAKDLAEAGIEVLSPDVPGEKHGNVRIAFGDPKKNPTVYQINYVPVVLELKAGRISFEGRTAADIEIRITVACGDVTEI